MSAHPAHSAPDRSRVVTVIDGHGGWTDVAQDSHTVEVVAPADAELSALLDSSHRLVNLAAPGALGVLAALQSAGAGGATWGYLAAPDSPYAVPLGPVETAGRPIEGASIVARLRGRLPRDGRILIVGGDAATCLTLRPLLAHEGWSVAIAWDARQAADTLPLVRPHVVIVDLGDPTRGGHEVVLHLASADPAPAMLLVPGRDDEGEFLVVLERLLRAAAICPRQSVVSALVRTCTGNDCPPREARPSSEVARAGAPRAAGAPNLGTSPTDPARRACAAAVQALDEGKEIVAILGEAGAGKTTILRALHAGLGGAPRSVLVLDPATSLDDIFHAAAQAIGLPLEQRPAAVTVGELAAMLRQHAPGGAVPVLLVDDAHLLAASVLHALRRLPRSGERREPAVQVVLAGSPRLRVGATGGKRSNRAAQVVIEPRPSPVVPPPDTALRTEAPMRYQPATPVAPPTLRVAPATAAVGTARPAVRRAPARSRRVTMAAMLVAGLLLGRVVLPAVEAAFDQQTAIDHEMARVTLPPPPAPKPEPASQETATVAEPTPPPAPAPAPPDPVVVAEPRPTPPPQPAAQAEPVPALPGTPLEPFVRPVPGSRWTVQVAATKSAAAAADIRAALAARGIAATIGAAVVGETTWHRVVVGEHATRAAAERAAAALARDLAAR